MMHLHDDDHVQDVTSTGRGSCNTRMECRRPSASSVQLGSVLIFFLHLVLALLCTQKQKSVFVLSFPLQLGSTRPDRQRKKNIPLRLLRGCSPPPAGSVSVRQPSVRPSVCCFFFFFFPFTLEHESTVEAGSVARGRGLLGLKVLCARLLLGSATRHVET